MCGIIGYIGPKNTLPLLVEGLRKESYRGYDSSGVVVFGNNDDVYYARSVGSLGNLEKKLKGAPFFGNVGLGHNRWATHGNVTEKNAHPHADCKENIFVVHNGIIENYQTLKETLKKEGHIFMSDTDTEVFAHLIEHFFKGNLEEAVSRALAQVKGAYGIAVIAKQDPSKIVAARLSAPLVISINGSGGFIASDPAAISAHSNKVIFLDDGEMAVIKKDSYIVTDLKNHVIEKTVTNIRQDVQDTQKNGYAHFMLKEIMEHPESLENALRGRLLVGQGRVKLASLDALQDRLKSISAIEIIACGGSAYAAMAAEYMLEEYAKIPTKVDVASEFRYKNPVFNKKTLYVFISQSGETADTLAALREVKAHGELCIGIVNVVGSTLAREVDAGIYTHSGPEIAVASTKTFTAQLAALSLLALFLARQRQMSVAVGRKFARELSNIPNLARQVLQEKAKIKKIAKKYTKVSGMCVIGRKYHYPIALEGALKLKEVAYVHGEGIEGGELKHGPLSLIGKHFPVIAICTKDSVYDKMISNIQQVKGRSGPVIAIATKGDNQIQNIADDVIYVPKTMEPFTPILSAVVLHLFAYFLAALKGCEIDQPRNLAKSVTVE